MKSFFIFLFSIFILSSVTSVSFSPSSLIYEVKATEEQCQRIHLYSESSSITVTDSWAENPEVEWSVSKFESSSSSHDLFLTYPKKLSGEKRDVEICISGKEEGEYHGAIIFKQEQEGSSVIQIAIWLKVLIGEEYISKASSKNSFSSSGGRSSSSSAQSSSSNSLPVMEAPTPEGAIQDTSGRAKITGAVIGSESSGINYTGMMIIALIIIVGISAVYYRKYKQKQRWLGYS